MKNREIDQLHELARLYRLETSFYDGLGSLRQAPPEAVLAVLQSMGAPLNSMRDVSEALRERESSWKDRGIEPVTVAWQGEPSSLEFRFPLENDHKSLLKLESGEIRDIDLRPAEEVAPGGAIRWRYPLPTDLPTGYHRLEVETGSRVAHTLLIVSPKGAFPAAENEHFWGVFAPLYALSSERNWGSGDFTDLANLARWVSSLGGHFVGTLPLFSAFLKKPLDPSPYAPVSRLFWNEFFIDPTQTPQWEKCVPAQDLYNSAGFQETLLRHRRSSQVDYESQMQLKRAVLELLAQDFYSGIDCQDECFRQFLEKQPSVDRYARFRAVQEQFSQPWTLWPQRMRNGELLEEDYKKRVKDYHVYVQWVATRQMESIRTLSKEQRVGLYLDLPLGVHPDGYDVWMHQDLFAPGVSGGAPPDSFFTNGQDWGFRPVHPEWSRIHHHSYFRQTISHLMAHSDLLRIDHVMSMHRLYWVPSGFSAKDGVYVHYPKEELFAILNLESHRKDCVIVGEDLGTVPPVVRESMAAHGIYRMYVSIFEVSPRWESPLNQVPPDTLAGLNTHDTATFAAFWQGLDIVERRQMGLLDEKTYEEETSARAAVADALCHYFSIEGDRTASDVQFAVLKSLLGHLSRSEARYLLLNLEDFWLETLSQNVPGTGPERPNWRNKTRLTFEQFSVFPELLQILEKIGAIRRRTKEND